MTEIVVFHRLSGPPEHKIMEINWRNRVRAVKEKRKSSKSTKTMNHKINCRISIKKTKIKNINLRNGKGIKKGKKGVTIKVSQRSG